MSTTSKLLKAAEKQADRGDNSLYVKMNIRSEMILEIQKLLLDFNAMPAGESKKKLGVEIDKKNRELSAYKEETKSIGHNINANFRGIAGKCLPKYIYARILHESCLTLEDDNYEAKPIDVLTDEDHTMIQAGKVLSAENISLKRKIQSTKKVIESLMPNFLGALDKDEYDFRLAKSKELKAILKELL